MMTTPLRAPLLWLLLPFMAGLATAELTAARAAFTVGSLTALGVGLALLAGGPRREWTWSAGVLLLAGVAGYWWLPLRGGVEPGWSQPPREVEVVLEIDQVFPPAPQRKTFSGLARVVEAAGPARPLAGQRVYFSAIKRVSLWPEVSGRYRFRGVVSAVVRTEQEIGFGRYLDALGVRAQLQRGQIRAELAAPTPFRRFCEHAQARLGRILALGLERHAELRSVYAAMLLGEKALLAPEQQTAFMRSGVFHIFSISGLHVGVIAAAILAGLKLLRAPTQPARVLGLAVLWLYVQITGASVPAERAFLMIAFVVAAKVLRLPGNALAALAGAALATLLQDPRQLFSAGFQMSYSVVAALLVLGAPLAERWLARWRPWRDLPEVSWRWWQHAVRDGGAKVLEGGALTWAATLASAPSSIGNFGLLSPGALVANLVVIPLSSLALVAGFVSLLGGLLGLDGLAIVMNHAAAVAILAMDWLVRHGTELPGVYVLATFRAPWMGSAGLVIVLGSLALAANPWLGRHAPGWLPPLALAAVLILGVKFP